MGGTFLWSHLEHGYPSRAQRKIVFNSNWLADVIDREYHVDFIAITTEKCTLKCLIFPMFIPVIRNRHTKALAMIGDPAGGRCTCTDGSINKRWRESNKD